MDPRDGTRMSEDRGPSSPAVAATSVWMVVAIALALGVTRLEEIAPYPVLFLLLAAVYGVAPPALLAWAFALRRPKRRHAMLVGGSVLLVSVLLVAGAGWFLRMSARLNFEMHKPDYDAVVLDALHGRLRGKLDRAGRLHGVSHGVRFIYDTRRPGHVEFPLTINPVFTDRVEFDVRPCTGKTCPGEPLGANYRRTLQPD